MINDHSRVSPTNASNKLKTDGFLKYCISNEHPIIDGSWTMAFKRGYLCGFSLQKLSLLHRISVMCLALMIISSMFGLATGEKVLPDLSKIPTPPSFIHEPNPLVTYYIVETPTGRFAENNASLNVQILRKKRLACRAAGYPSVTYRWLKDGEPFNLTDSQVSMRITPVPGEGSFFFDNLLEADQGTYQCLAENGNGTAKDQAVKFTKAYMDNVASPTHHQIITVKYGEFFAKDCPAPFSVPPARIYWILGNCPETTSVGQQFLTINFTNVAVNDNGTIYFQYVTHSDTNMPYCFACIAENRASNDVRISRHFKFSIDPASPRKLLDATAAIPPVKQYVSPSRITALKGQSFELYCVFSGFPDLIPVWLHDGKELNLSDSRISMSTNFGKSIKLDNVSDADKGVYECQFKNARQIKETFTVTVDSVPFWVKKPHNVNLSEGSDAEFHCNADGNPKPEFSFFKNGEPVVPIENRILVDGDSLIIKNLTKGVNGSGDNAVYQCKSENRHGYIWTNFYLNILAFKPIVLEGPGKIEAVIGQDVTLKCQVYGSPKPDVDWTNPRTGAESGLDGERQHYEKTSVDHDGVTELRLRKVTKDHTGDYHCGFKNKYGEDSEKGTLRILEKTIVKQMEKTKNETAGTRLELKCDAYHDPELKVKFLWFFNGKQLSNDGRIYINENHTLIIDRPTADDSGSYKCLAKTKLDDSYRETEVVIRDVPFAPFQVQVSCFPTRAEVSFLYKDRSNNVPTNVNFIIQVNVDPTEPDAWETYPGISNPGGATKLNLGLGKASIYLYPYGDFAFRVLAKNEVGLSSPTIPYKVFDGVQNRCRTDPAIPDRNPLNVEVKGNAAGTLEVHWDPMPRRDQNGPEFQYLVQYKESGSSDDNDWKNYNVDRADRTSVVFDSKDNIKPYTPYDVRVWSKNEKGLSKEPKPEIKSGYSGEIGAPIGPPEKFRVYKIESYSAVTFTWKPVNKSSVNGAIKGYIIKHWYKTNKRAEEALFDFEADKGTVYDMKPNRMNFAQILVYNGVGNSEPTNPPLEISMPPGVPSQVLDLVAYSLNDSVIVVHWKQPRELNGNLTRYLVRYQRASEEHYYDDTKWANPVTVDANAPLEVWLKNLKAASKYIIEVVGVVPEAGEGDPRKVVAETTDEVVNMKPDFPLTPSLKEIHGGKDHINATYLPGKYDSEEKVSPGQHFYVRYRPKGSSTWHKVYTNATFFITIKDVKAATEYELQSVAVHGTNESLSSLFYHVTAGSSSVSPTAGWLIAIIVAIILLIIILIIVCLVVRNRGAKYPVSEKEKAQGREPMLKEEKGFGEYARPEPEEEKKSLTAESKHSGSEETDSMAEYGEAENARFTEDGSFIGQYGKQPNQEKLKTNNHHSSTVV